jgi:hypothetical protein
MSSNTNIDNMPDTIILDTEEALKKFEVFVKSIPSHYEITLENTIIELCHCLADAEDCREAVLLFLDELMDGWQEREYITDKSDEIAKEMHDVAGDIWAEMIRCKMFTHTGINWYEPFRLLGYNIVWTLVTDIETVQEDLESK